MSDTISKDTAIQHIRESDIPDLYKVSAIWLVDHVPATGTTEVVRCGECKYKFRNYGHDRAGCPLDREGMMNDNDFCSCGERKDNHETDIRT